MDLNDRVGKLLVRAVNWVGDAVMTTPAIGAVRASFPQAEITDVREGNHHSEAAAHQAEKIKLLVLASERAETHVLDDPNAVVGIDNLLTYLKEHVDAPGPRRLPELISGPRTEEES